MKKRQEGYVLVYVLIVIVLLALIGSTVCAISVRNLKAQQSSLARAQASYKAEGQVEQALGTIAAAPDATDWKVSAVKGADNAVIKAAALTDFTAWLKAELSSLGFPDCEITQDQTALDDDPVYLLISLTAHADTQQVSAQVRVPVQFTVTGTPEPIENDSENSLYSYSLSVGNISYLSYRVETVEPLSP